MSALLALVLSSTPAHAFCGTYVGDADAELFNHSSQVVMVRQGRQTTLTLGNDYEGDLSEFALVIPVPEVLREADVQLVDADLIDRVDGYSSPRMVEYSCDTAYYPDALAMAGSAACGPTPDESFQRSAGGVTVESSFAAGEYEIVVLSAEQSSGLFDWLEDNGFSVSESARPLLQEYIDQDLFFLAAKVNLGDAGGRTKLSPLQLSYESDSFGLPIRIGTASSAGSQDLILYTVTDLEDGRVGVANYPEVNIEDECMFSDATMSFADYYAARFDDVMSGTGAAWTVEYSWSPYHCDPCVDVPLEDADLRDLGFRGNGQQAHFTRLHMRYDKEAATQDLMLYASGLQDREQIRFIRYNEQLEDWLPVCGLGMVPDPHSCWDDEDWAARSSSREAALPVGPFWLTWLLLIPVAVRRARA